MNDLELMIAFHKAFIFPHFQVLQRGDPKTGGTLSFLGGHVTVMYYLIYKDIEGIKGKKGSKMNTSKGFRVTLATLDEAEKEQQKRN